MVKPIVISDPFPRELDLIFTKKKLKELKRKYKLIVAPKRNKDKFYEKNIHNATFIMGQPDLKKKLLSKAKKLRCIINVESNFMNNVDYEYCFKKNIHIIATSPVFSIPVAEIALGMTLSLLRNIHNSHFDFINGKEIYGLKSNMKASLLTNKKIGLLGFGDLAKALYPLLLPFSKKINVYDPWVPKKQISRLGFKSVGLNEMFKECEIIYVLAAITTENKNLIDKKLINKMRQNIANIFSIPIDDVSVKATTTDSLQFWTDKLGSIGSELDVKRSQYFELLSQEYSNYIDLIQTYSDDVYDDIKNTTISYHRGWAPGIDFSESLS